MNAENPNNRRERVLIFHNQWLYGYTALKINLDIMRRLKEGIKKRAKNGSFGKSKKDYINHFLQKSLINAINWAGLKDIHNEREFFKTQEFDFESWEDLGEKLNHQDNNNGFFICKIDKNLNIFYGFINGLEDEKPYNVKGCLSYLKLFYNDGDIEKINKENKNILNKVIEGYKKFEGLKILDLKKVTETLNKAITIEI